MTCVESVAVTGNKREPMGNTPLPPPTVKIIKYYCVGLPQYKFGTVTMYRITISSIIRINQ